MQFIVLTEDHPHYLPLTGDDAGVFKNMSAVLFERRGFSPVVITNDLVGIVTVHDGPSLPQGEIIAPTVGESDPDLHHNSFQDPERFLAAGGTQGRQLQVLVEGTFYINRLFATVETIPKTVVEVGHVGVVVSYTGASGTDLSGDTYRHGELVRNGERGVWSMPLLPDKYAFNTYAGRVSMVPTTNFILKWIRSEAGGHGFDENLSEVSLITKDAFEPSLPLSVVVHIDYKKAPLVIQQFGDVKKLVEQTLDPMVAAYFKILTQLRARQIAEEQIGTYGQQEKAAAKERELREAEARARTQQALTESEISITIQSNQGKADYQRSVQQAAQIRALAEAEADKTKLLGSGEAQRIKSLAEAEAEKAARVGIAEAMAIDEQVRAYGGPQLQLTRQVLERFSEAVELGRIDVVPKVMINGSSAPGSGTSGSAFEALLGLLLSDRLSERSQPSSEPRDPRLDQARDAIRNNLMASVSSNGTQR